MYSNFRILFLFSIAGLLVQISSCSKGSIPELLIESDLTNELTSVPEGFDELSFPEDNPFSVEKWEMGKRLFYDPALSRDLSISCASCHKQDLAFSDDLDVSPGVDQELGNRNAPSLANVAYHPYYTREGGVPTLEMQILVPIQEHAEFDFNIVEICSRLNEDAAYLDLSTKAFGTEITPFALTRALATFERTLISGNSAYDQFLRGDALLSASEKRGKDLFFSAKTNCSSCHSGFNFTDYSFRNNGYESGDIGRMRLTLDSSDYSIMKVASLRNVALSAPYMHDGSFSTLRQVIDQYNAGGNSRYKDPLIKPLSLTEFEIEDLISFLNSLTDQTFISNENFQE